LLPSALLESEEALNKGSLTASEVFVSLKTRSILHLFAAIGRFLGHKVVFIIIYCIYIYIYIFLLYSEPVFLFLVISLSILLQCSCKESVNYSLVILIWIIFYLDINCLARAKSHTYFGIPCLTNCMKFCGTSFVSCDLYCGKSSKFCILYWSMFSDRLIVPNWSGTD